VEDHQVRQVKSLCASVSAVAILALSDPASAGGHWTDPIPGIPIFAVQGVAANNFTVAIPQFLTFTPPGGTFTTGSFQLVFTMPAGVTFGTSPTLSVTSTFGSCPANPALAPSGGGAGSNSAIYNVPTVKTGKFDFCTFGISAYTLNNAKILGTEPGAGPNVFLISGQTFNASPPANAFVNLQAPATTTLAESFNAWGTTDNIGNANTPNFIDILQPAFAKQFIGAAATTPSLVGDIGGFRAGVVAGLENALNTAPFTFLGTSFNLTLTASNFANITSAFINSANSCPASPPSGSPIGTVSGNTITFTSLALKGGPPIVFNGGATSEICLVANGTGILQPSGAITAAFTIDSGASDQTTNSSPQIAYGYNGIVNTYSYALTGSNLAAGFTSFLRLVNTNSISTVIPANVWVDGANGQTSGTTASLLLENPLAANGADTLTFASILTTAGLTAPADGRAFIQVLLPAGTNSSMLLGNPNNTFVFNSHD
jgi:hypothetical protein